MTLRESQIGISHADPDETEIVQVELGITDRNHVFIQWPQVNASWYLTPAEAREIAASLEMLALKAEGKEPS